MNKFLILLFSLIIIQQAFGQNSGFKQLNSNKFNNIINRQKGTLIDVRTYLEFANGHINKAGQLNYYALNFKQKLSFLPKNKPVYLYCNTGYRSKKAAQFLVKNGYSQVYNLA